MLLYQSLLLVTVTLHVSSPLPTLRDPNHYAISSCSGVFISPNEILTANHCIAESRGHQWIKTSEGFSYSVSVIKKDSMKDLALLQIDKPIHHAYVKIGKQIDITDKIYTVNSGDDNIGTYTEGYVANIVTFDDNLIILHSAVIYPGASGSGLYNKKRELVGINTCLMSGLSGAVDVYEIRRFLKL